MPNRPRPEKFHLDGPAGRLEALLETPAGTADRGAALVCHPHPQHGGTMQNKVTHTLARSFLECGLRALRFNFRGVGRSEGEFDEARGEVDDALAALHYLKTHWPEGPVWMSGFSFGAAIAIRAAAEEEPAGLITVAPAVYRFAGTLAAQPECPWLIVHGEQDELIAMDQIIDWVNGMGPGPELRVFPDTGHFFHGKLVALRAAASTFIRSHAA